MSAHHRTTAEKPDLTQGIALDEFKDGGKLLGRVDGEEVLLVRQGAEVFAVGAHCTHYHGPLADGLAVDGTVRCPLHHACFDLRTGEALRAPAFDPLPCWEVEQRDGRIFVGAKRESAQKRRRAAAAAAPRRIAIVGGGAAGFAAAEMLRRDGYDGDLVMLSEDDAAPVDRPNLSKDYLAGQAQEDWIPLRPADFYAEHAIDLRLAARVTGLDIRERRIALAGGDSIAFDRLLLAPGAEPRTLSLPGAGDASILTLRSLADSRAIIERAAGARRAVVLGASFIGLEVAAALRTRGLEVSVVAPEARPMERILGPQLGDFIRGLHEQHGVTFHLGETAHSIERGRVKLAGGAVLEADLVVAGVGVSPRIDLAEKAGLKTGNGIVVNAMLETSAPGIFAAGDVACWPDPHSGERLRVEHWVVAERQGQVAARNMLGAGERFADVPFFWSQHYDVTIRYTGHAAAWDELTVEGDLARRDCAVRFRCGGRLAALATIGRDGEALRFAAEMEGVGNA